MTSTESAESAEPNEPAEPGEPPTPGQRLGRGLARIREQPIDERQAAARQVAQAMRVAIDRLTGTSAPPGVLADAAAKMEEVVALLEGYGPNRRYGGFAEASGGGHDRRYFDWSPQLGLANPLAPPIEVQVGGETVVARARFGAAYEGPPGCVHGGFVAAAFDEVLGLTQTLSGQVGITGTLTVRYRRPTPLHTDLRFEGRLVSVSGRKVVTSARLYAADALTAEATGLFISVTPERFAALVATPSPVTPDA